MSDGIPYASGLGEAYTTPSFEIKTLCLNICWAINLLVPLPCALCLMQQRVIVSKSPSVMVCIYLSLMVLLYLVRCQLFPG